MESIRVAKDHWNFEGRDSGCRFVPFGCNFVFDFPKENDRDDTMRSLDILTDTDFRRTEIEQAMKTAHELHMNVMKVFLPICAILPDPQADKQATFASMTPSLFERLDFLFETAEKNEIYLSLTMAEWGAHTLQWFHDGGALFGAQTEDGPDSYAILADAWRQLATYCKGKPVLFSYNLAVELYVPGGNWGAEQQSAEEGAWYAFSERYAHRAFRAFLRRKYTHIEALNASHGTAYADFEEVQAPLAFYWDAQRACYNVSRPVMIDYNEFKESTCYLFLKNMADAIRSVDPDHMITAGLHPDQTGLAPEGYAYKIAGTNNRDYDFLDYVTVHLYTNAPYLIDRSQPFEGEPGIYRAGAADETELVRRLRECELYARYIWSDKPLMLEEFGHHVDDAEESYDVTKRTVEALAGHVSGFMLWVLGDAPLVRDKCAPMDVDFAINAWGENWKALNEPGGIVYEYPLERTPAKTHVMVDYADGYAPMHTSVGETIIRHWESYPAPVDFHMAKNPMIALYKAGGWKKIW